MFVHWDALRSRVEHTRGWWLLEQAASATPTSTKLGRKWGQRREEHVCDLILRSLKETGMRVFSRWP